MNDDQKKLYRALGFTGPLPGDQPEVSFSAGGVEELEEVPPLDAAGLDQLEEMLNEHPRKTMARVREVWDRTMTEKRLREAIAHARRALQAPHETIAEIEATTAPVSFSLTGFSFPGMDPAIEINPDDRKFENDDFVGVLGWIFGAGPFVINRASEKGFRFHDQTRSYYYQVADPQPDKPLDIALFSDFGVGRYYSEYIAKQFRERRFPYAIHLGDVYYAGRPSEFRDYFDQQINPILDFTRVFALNSNHEMYSEGKSYFKSMTGRAEHQSKLHQQEGSYFCLQSEKFQIIGIDTAYFGSGRYKEKALVEWLAKALREGRQTGRVNILLSADHPYEYGKKQLTKLLDKDLRELALGEKLVDLWFWGNTHYGALFDHRPKAEGNIPALPFIGSCIGHGGYPYDTYQRGKFEPAPMLFLEDQSRFPGTDIRPDRGNNGYCVMRLKADGSIELRYIDWMSNLRYAASLTREAGGGPLKVTTIPVNP